jgi:hypothetical protein
VEVLFFDFRPAVNILSFLHTHDSHESCAIDTIDTTTLPVHYRVLRHEVLAPRLADRGVGKLRTTHLTVDHTINAYNG